MQRGRPVSLADFRQRIEAGAARLNLIIKADVDGSIEALSDSLEKLATEEVKLDIIHRGVGNVNESDVLLAAASDAAIVGFHVRTEARASTIAHEKAVDINLYRVIYEAVDAVKSWSGEHGTVPQIAARELAPRCWAGNRFTGSASRGQAPASPPA